MTVVFGTLLPPQKCFCNVNRRFVAPNPSQTERKGNRKAQRLNAIKEPEVETVEEIENDMDNQSTASLYARFDSLLDNTMQDYNLGDSVRGTVAT